MPKGSKVAKAEALLKAGAAKRGITGGRADAYVYGTLNKEGLMRGNKATPRGRSPAKKGR